MTGHDPWSDAQLSTPTPPRPDGVPVSTGESGSAGGPRRHGGRGLRWWGLGLVVIVGVSGALLLARHSGRSASPGTSPQRSLAPGVPPVAAGSHLLSGTLTYPGMCAGRLRITIQDPSGKEIANAPVSQAESSGNCDGTFSTRLVQASTYRFALGITDASGHSMGNVAGPPFTAAELASEGYHLALTLDRFGMNPARFQVQVDLQTAIVAAQGYYRTHGKSFQGLTASRMQSLAPSLSFNAAATATTGQVTLRLATRTEVLFVGEAGDGTPVAMGFRPPALECYGELDAKTFGACIAWQPPGGSGVPSPPSGPIPMSLSMRMPVAGPPAGRSD